ncbi:hypothetical protein C8R44DRAFT_751898 [Mycena epipterygia]|nr:hypothetical protein C8R44DRAFT_751898 [Mycena epipterygia]
MMRVSVYMYECRKTKKQAHTQSWDHAGLRQRGVEVIPRPHERVDESARLWTTPEYGGNHDCVRDLFVKGTTAEWVGTQARRFGGNEGERFLRIYFFQKSDLSPESEIPWEGQAEAPQQSISSGITEKSREMKSHTVTSALRRTFMYRHHSTTDFSTLELDRECDSRRNMNQLKDLLEISNPAQARGKAEVAD